MNRYELPIPRTALGIAAITLSAMTFGLAVVLPASLTPEPQESRAQTAPTVEVSAIRVVAIDPARIVVVGEREQTTALDRAQTPTSKRAPSS